MWRKYIPRAAVAPDAPVADKEKSRSEKKRENREMTGLYPVASVTLCMQRTISLVESWSRDETEDKDKGGAGALIGISTKIHMLWNWKNNGNPYARWFFDEFESAMDKLLKECDRLSESADNAKADYEREASQIKIKWTVPRHEPEPRQMLVFAPMVSKLIELIVQIDKIDSKVVTLERCGIDGYEVLRAESRRVFEQLRNIMAGINESRRQLEAHGLSGISVKDLRSRKHRQKISDLEKSLQRSLPNRYRSG